MQNTMVRGGWSAGEKKIKIRKNEKGERKKEENYIKKGRKALKMHQKNLPPQTYLSGEKY